MSRTKILLALFFFTTVFCFGQQTGVVVDRDTIVNKMKDSLTLTKDDSTKEGNEIAITWKTYYRLGSDNFKTQALFPLYLKKHDWLKFGGYAIATGISALVNKPVQRSATALSNNNPAVAKASRFITKFGWSYGLYTLSGLTVTSMISKNQKFRNTTLLATQAYFISNLVGGAAKVLFSVQGPFYTDPLTGKKGPIFHGPFYTLKKGPDGKKLQSTNYVSFPSGHAYSAFSIATVYAMQYKDRPLIPIICYSAASLVSLSRLTENRHWAMDIIPGVVLGYYSGKQVVRNFHRYSKNKLLSKPVRNSLSLNVQYTNCQLIPGLCYRF